MLLTCCWMSSYQKRYFQLYPSTFGFDVTHGTNAEKRPLGRGTVISPNRKITTVLNSLLPSEAAWVFGWLFKAAIPELVNNRQTLCQITMVPTDEDKQCMGQVHVAIIEKVMPNAHQRIWCWHKVDCGYILKVKTKKKAGVDGIFVYNCKDWFYSSTIDIDLAEKETMHIKYFETWLDYQEEFITKELFEYTSWFWKRNFKENIHFFVLSTLQISTWG